MRTMIPRVFILILWGTGPALAQLPPEILADSYLLRVEQAIGEGDHTRARAGIDKLILLQKEHELDLPDEFQFRYAKAAAAAGLADEALDAVVKYLTAAGREGRHYVEALQLMNKAQDEIEGRKQPPPPGCGQWNTEEFFGTATAETVSACLNAGADVAARDDDRISPLHWAAWSNGSPSVIDVLVAAGANLEARNKNDRTPLHNAAWNNKNPAVIEALLAAGADVAARTAKDSTPLHLAALSNESPAVIEALLAAGADVAARTAKDSTPLHNAAWNNKNPAVIEALLAAGADVAARTAKDSTPLHNAAWNNKNPAVIEALLAAGADVAAREEDGFTPLHQAAWSNESPAVIEELLAAGADVAARGEDDFTPLHLAVLNNGNPAVIEALLAAGADAMARMSGGSTPWSLAQSNGKLKESDAYRRLKEAAGGGSHGTSAESSTPARNAAVPAGAGTCEIPGYPSPPGGMANLGLWWCPASVGMQLRAFALQAAGAQCALATGNSSTPEQVQAQHREIAASCERLAALNAPNCRCPAGLRP